MTKRFLIFSVLIGCFYATKAQQIDKKMQAAVSAIYADFNNIESAGIAGAVFHNDEVILSNTFGYANLADQEEISLDSPFHLTGMTPHFTAFAILLLEDQGKLKLSDPLSKHLADFPAYAQTITIEHLLAHTSGLPEYWTMIQLLGADGLETIQHHDVLPFLHSDWELSNQPGETYRYSGTGGKLMALVVESVTGQAFREYYSQEILYPLGMSQSYFIDAEQLDRLPKSYTTTGEAIPTKLMDYGASGFVTTMNDMKKWYNNIARPMVGSKKMMTKLDSTPRLNSGEEIDTPNGILTYGQQYKHLERGIMKIWDYGAYGGFASSVFRFPAENYTFVTMSNNSIGYNGSYGMQTADIVLADKFGEEEEDMSAFVPDYTPLTQEHIDLFVGDYFDVEAYTPRVIRYRDDTLRYFRPNFNDENILRPMEANVLHLPSPFGYYTFHLSDTEPKRLEIRVGGQTYTYEKYNKVKHTKAELEAFEGIFLSEQTLVTYQFKRSESGLVAHRTGHEPIDFVGLREDEFVSNTNYLNAIHFIRDKSNNVTGFRLMAEQMAGLTFTKVAPVR